MKKKYFVIGVLVVLLLGSNLCWFKLYRREEQRLKNAVIPTLGNDYYNMQLALTNYAKEYLDMKEVSSSEVNSSMQKDVFLVEQNPLYPNGCEAASAVMLLNYYGYAITLDEFVNNYLSKDDVYEEKGVRYGPNPAVSYAGNPSSSNRGWGCFDTVVYNAINEVMKDYSSYEVNSVTKNVVLPFTKTHLRDLKVNSPVIIWVTIGYEEAGDIYTWRSYDGKETYTYPKNSHVVVLTGYDKDYYYINDPLKNEKNIRVKKEVLEKSYDSLGRQVIYFE